MTEALRQRLRALPDFPADLPSFDPDSAPEDPVVLFRDWLEDAIRRGVRQPHAFSLATATARGAVSSRILILKDVDEDGWQFATSRDSRKALELGQNSAAAMNFYWSAAGRQVRVVGHAVELSDEASLADWLARPTADGTPNADWRLYGVRPTEIEFWQARHDRNHRTRRYRVGAEA